MYRVLDRDGRLILIDGLRGANSTDSRLVLLILTGKLADPPEYQRADARRPAATGLFCFAFSLQVAA